jgi:hypothetical protein
MAPGTTRILLLVLAVAAAFLSWRIAFTPDPASGASLPAMDPARADADIAPEPSVGAVPESPSERQLMRGIEFLIVDASSQRALAGATMTTLEAGAPAPTLTVPPHYLAAEDGRLAVPRPIAPGATLLFRAPGYAPRTFEWTAGSLSQEPHVVELVAGATLAVQVIDRDGRPVPDAVVALSVHPEAEFVALLLEARTGPGHPLSPRPLWVERVDGTGKALFEEVPSAEYFLDVVARQHFPDDELGAHGRLQLGVGRRDLGIVMKEAHAALCQVPSAVKVADVHWKVPRDSLVAARGFSRRLGGLQAEVGRRFPDCLVYVANPHAGSSPVLVECKVRLEDGSLWTGQAQLLPVSMLDAPVFLTEVVRPSRAISVRILTPSGNELSGVPFHASSPEVSMDGESGVPLTIPHGTYSLSSVFCGPDISSVFQGHKLQVDDASPAEVVLRASSELTEVRVNVHYPGEEVLAPLSIGIGGMMIVNWTPARERIRSWLRGERVKIRVDSTAYEEVLIDQPLPRSGPMVVDIRLREKPVTRNQ